MTEQLTTLYNLSKKLEAATGEGFWLEYIRTYIDSDEFWYAAPEGSRTSVRVHMRQEDILTLIHAAAMAWLIEAYPWWSIDPLDCRALIKTESLIKAVAHEVERQIKESAGTPIKPVV